MTKEQEKEVKELAEDLLKCIEDCGIHYLDCPVYLKGGQMDIKLNQCKKCFAQHLISKGYRKAGELTVISDGRVADLSKIEKKHKLTFGEVMRDIEKTFGVAGNGLKYSQFILDTLDAEREQAYKAQRDHDREA